LIRCAKSGKWLFCAIAFAYWTMSVQSRAAESEMAEVRLHIASSTPGKARAVPAVVWLEPAPGTPTLSFVPQGHYTLLQKNRMFVPHLQVIPVGAVVQFPNADPFFHNVFSLFDGKRFDLGLYEAGSTKSVNFSREGVSYIFCNIHPEMSAVVLALSTPLYAVADASNAFILGNVPPGDYHLHIWIEGVPHSNLEREIRRVHLSSGTIDLGQIAAPMSWTGSMNHTNKFGKPYTPDPQGIY
jgi:plastocyanin